MVRLFIKSFGDPEVTSSQQYMYAGGLCLATFLHTIIIHTVNFQLYCMAMKFRVAISSLVYRKVKLANYNLQESVSFPFIILKLPKYVFVNIKILKLSRAAQDQTTVGHIINLLGNDVYRLDLFLLFMGYIITGPLQLSILTYILWNEIGISCLAGIGFVSLLMPLQCKSSSLKLQTQIFLLVRMRSVNLNYSRLYYFRFSWKIFWNIPIGNFQKN